jgi:hypothetical protein
MMKKTRTIYQQEVQQATIEDDAFGQVFAHRP